MHKVEVTDAELSQTPLTSSYLSKFLKVSLDFLCAFPWSCLEMLRKDGVFPTFSAMDICSRHVVACGDCFLKMEVRELRNQ